MVVESGYFGPLSGGAGSIDGVAGEYYGGVRGIVSKHINRPSFGAHSGLY
jgi:hypothetical protein